MFEANIGKTDYVPFSGVKVLGADGDNTVFGSVDYEEVKISELLTKYPKLPYSSNEHIWRSVLTKDSWLYLTFRLAENHGWMGDAPAQLLQHDTIYSKFLYQRDRPGAFSQMVHELMQLWTMDGSTPVTEKEIVDIVSEIPVRDMAKETLRRARELGIETVLFTSSYSTYAENRGKAVGFDKIYYNSKLNFDLKGHLLSFSQQPQDVDYKVLQVTEYLRKNKLRNRDFMYVGDGYTDEGVFKMRNVSGIAFNTHNKVLIEKAVAHVENFTDLYTIIDGLNRSRPNF